jgi:antitoxin PrlF
MGCGWAAVRRSAPTELFLRRDRHCLPAAHRLAIPDPYYYALRKEALRPEKSMTTESTLTSKGQTTIPQEIRESLSIKPGDRMTFTLMPDGTVLLRVKNKSVMGLAGSLRKKGQKAVPVEDLSR